MPRSKQKKSLPINIYRKIAFSFIGLTLLLILIIIYFSAARATIIIKPVKEKINTNFSVTIKKAPQMNELQELDIVAGRTLELVKEKEQKFKTTLSELADVQATGKATIINTSPRSQPLVATTRLLSKEGVLFRIKDGTIVPAAGEVAVDVYADQQGKQGEIGPTTFTIPGLNQARQKQVTAKSLKAMTGGTRKLTAVTEQGINKAKEELIKDLQRLALQELRSELKKGEKLLSQEEILESSVDTKLGAEIEEFTLKLKVRVRGIVFGEEKILALAERNLKANLPNDKELVSFSSENLNYTLKEYNSEKEIAKAEVSTKGEMVLKPSSPIIDKTRLIGLAIEEVKALLLPHPSIEDLEIKFQPFWKKRLPTLKDHVIIKIKK